MCRVNNDNEKNQNHVFRTGDMPRAKHNENESESGQITYDDLRRQNRTAFEKKMHGGVDRTASAPVVRPPPDVEHSSREQQAETPRRSNYDVTVLLISFHFRLSLVLHSTLQLSPKFG